MNQGLIVDDLVLFAGSIRGKRMQKSAGSNLNENTHKWPYLPPWYLQSSPQVAALLEVTPETLHTWRTLGEAPKSVSTALIRPTQGNPTYFRLAQIRKWASERIGMSYKLQDQIIDFLLDFFPADIVSLWALDELVRYFDHALENDLRLHRNGRKTDVFVVQHVLDWDNYRSRQPKFVQPKQRYFDLFYAILKETPREHMHPLTPRQLEHCQEAEPAGSV